MKERRKNLHSIISKISGNVDQIVSEADTEGPIITSVTGSSDNKSHDNAVSEMKLADEQPQRPVTRSRMYIKEQESPQLTQDAAINHINTQLLDPAASPPFICDLCTVAFLTKRELQLHVMCHGIHIAGNIVDEKVEAVVQGQGESPSPGTDTTGEANNGVAETASDGSVVVNNEVKIVDVLSLATATRGFKEPGSIWCSLCKCTVDKGHTCKVYQTSYHAEKTEEGFTCELCGRFYNQKRKLRTHLRNRHKGFRLQEDEGYMCWQCWQAFPEIKILEEHIVQVHGHESRRQNSTWRPFTQPSTLPLDENEESGSPDPNTSPVETSPNLELQNIAPKRTSDDSLTQSSAKKPHLDLPNGVLSVAEVNGKIVVTDTSVATENPSYPMTNNLTPSNPIASPADVAEVSKKPEVGNESSLGRDHLGVVNSPMSGHPNGTGENDKLSPNMAGEKLKTKTVGNQCPHCAEIFAKKYMVQLHIQEVHGENMHCFFCSTSCGTKEVLSTHIKTAHPEEMKNGKCPICQCKCLGKLHQHIVQYHHKDLLTRKTKDRVLSTCPICHQTTTDAYHLRWHILQEHRGLQLPKELQDGLNEDTGSESGSSVGSERRMSSEGSDKIPDNTKGQKSISESNSEQEESKQDELEIVFVSDKNINSGWSNPKAKIPPQSNIANENAPVECVKKPADSSVGVNPKPDQAKSNPGEVHSTTGQVEQTNERVTTSPVKYDYHSISEDTCVFCFKKLTKESLSSHLRTDHGWVDTFTCPVCSVKADKYLTIVEHFCHSHFHPTDDVTMTQCDAKCLKCDIIFQDISHLKKHSSALHSFQLPSEASYNTFKCRHCNIIFEKQFDAQKHFDVYHLFRIRFKCESCRMGFTAKHDFQEHVTCNHPELVKSFCPVCGLGFEVSSDLEEHVFEMHRRKAQFFCAQCGNEFGDRFHVHMHIRSNCCVTWADSNFECLDCLTAFSSISELRIHCKQRNCKLDVKT